MKGVRVTAACGAAVLASLGVLPVAAAEGSEAPAPVSAPNPASTPEASILFFQDGHDAMPVNQGKKDAPNFHGGAARLATVVKDQRADGVPSDLVFGGDLGGGTLFGAVFHGEAMVDLFNKIGVDLAGFGQHDFDYGVEQTRKNVADSRFPWVSSNLTVAGHPFNGAENITAVRTVGGLKIGYIGLTAGMDTTSVSGQVMEEDYVSAAKSAVVRLGEVDIVVALAQFPKAADATKLLQEVPQISVVLREENEAKQEGNDVTMLPDGRFAVAPEGNYGSVARIDFVRGADGHVVAKHREVQVDGTVAEDLAIAQVAGEYQDKLDARLAQQVGCSERALAKPTELGHVAAEAFRRVADADFGWVNAGGVRADLPAGPVTMKDVWAVFPYGNKVMKIEATGAQLRAALEQGADSAPEGNSAGYPLVAGFDFVYDAGAPAGAKISGLVRADGSEIKDADRVVLAVTNYVVNGGNKVEAFKGARVLAGEGTLDTDFEALEKFLTTTQCGNPAPSPSPETSLSPAPVLSPAPGATGSDSRKVAPGALANTGSSVLWVCGVAGVALMIGVVLRRKVKVN